MKVLMHRFQCKKCGHKWWTTDFQDPAFCVIRCTSNSVAKYLGSEERELTPLTPRYESTEWRGDEGDEAP